jgi:hypothetical protein
MDGMVSISSMRTICIALWVALSAQLDCSTVCGPSQAIGAVKAWGEALAQACTSQYTSQGTSQRTSVTRNSNSSIAALTDVLLCCKTFNATGGAWSSCCACFWHGGHVGASHPTFPHAATPHVHVSWVYMWVCTNKPAECCGCNKLPQHELCALALNLRCSLLVKHMITAVACGGHQRPLAPRLAPPRPRPRRRLMVSTPGAIYQG